MPFKETGAIYIVKCPVCGDELVLGWLRDLAEIPFFDAKAKQIMAATDANKIGSAKQTCSCGNASAQLNLGKCRVEWQTAEPIVGNHNLH